MKIFGKRVRLVKVLPTILILLLAVGVVGFSFAQSDTATVNNPLTNPSPAPFAGNIDNVTTDFATSHNTNVTDIYDNTQAGLGSTTYHQILATIDALGCLGVGCEDTGGDLSAMTGGSAESGGTGVSGGSGSSGGTSGGGSSDGGGSGGSGSDGTLNNFQIISSINEQLAIIENDIGSIARTSVEDRTTVEIQIARIRSILGQLSEGYSLSANMQADIRGATYYIRAAIENTGNVTTIAPTIAAATDKIDEIVNSAQTSSTNSSTYTATTANSSHAQLQNGGALGQAFSLIASTYTPPATTYTYVADVMNNMGIETPAQAQGYGYHALSSTLNLWRIFRNMAYVFFTLIIIVVGFVIMFRQRIGGQAVVTVQQALPRIVLAIILVTFSYAIAGFMVDLMYLIMYTFISFLTLDPSDRANLIQGDFGYLFKRIMSGATNSAWGAVQGFVSGMFSESSWLWGKILGGIGGSIMYLITAVAALFAAFRLFFILIISYVTFLLSTIFGPLMIMIGAIPGVNTFQKWLRTLVANLSPFPVTMVLVSIQGVLVEAMSAAHGGGGTASNGIVSTAYAQGSSNFMPPYMLDGVGVTGEAIASIVSLGILLTIPEIVKKIKTAIGGSGGVFSEIANAAKTNIMAVPRSKPVKAVAKAAGTGVKKGATAVGARVLASAETSSRLRGKDREKLLEEGVRDYGTEEQRLELAASTATHQQTARQIADLQKQREQARNEGKEDRVKELNIAIADQQAIRAKAEQDRKITLAKVETKVAESMNAVNKAVYYEKGMVGGVLHRIKVGETEGLPGGKLLGELPTREKQIAKSDYLAMNRKVQSRYQQLVDTRNRQGSLLSEVEQAEMNRLEYWKSQADKPDHNLSTQANLYRRAKQQGLAWANPI